MHLLNCCEPGIVAVAGEADVYNAGIPDRCPEMSQIVASVVDVSGTANDGNAANGVPFSIYHGKIRVGAHQYPGVDDRTSGCPGSEIRIGIRD
jgi:hypothetical protein